jgi:hypothetical protein
MPGKLARGDATGIAAFAWQREQRACRPRCAFHAIRAPRALLLGRLRRCSFGDAAIALWGSEAGIFRSEDCCPKEDQMPERPLDAAGRRRSPATMPGFHAGRPPRNKGMRYPADPPTVEEIVAVMRAAGETVHGQRLRALIVVLWRAVARLLRTGEEYKCPFGHEVSALLGDQVADPLSARSA